MSYPNNPIGLNQIPTWSGVQYVDWAVGHCMEREDSRNIRMLKQYLDRPTVMCIVPVSSKSDHITDRIGRPMFGNKLHHALGCPCNHDG